MTAGENVTLMDPNPVEQGHAGMVPRRECAEYCPGPPGGTTSEGRQGNLGVEGPRPERRFSFARCWGFVTWALLNMGGGNLFKK